MTKEQALDDISLSHRIKLIRYTNKNSFWVNNYSGLPLPIAHPQPWSGQKEFLTKLLAIEKSLNSPSIMMEGYADSRLDLSNDHVGCGEYEYNGVRWTQGYSEHYIEKFNVRPSREFYDFIMSSSLPL